MKICLIGAGSFVFGPTVLHDAIVEHRLDGAHLALVDPRLEMAELMAGLGRRMANASGIRAQLTAHREWQEALAGADFAPVVVGHQGVHPRLLRLPEAVVRLSRPQAEINDRIVRAALTGQTALLEEALELDPTVLDKPAGRRALQACREVHADLL